MFRNFAIAFITLMETLTDLFLALGSGARYAKSRGIVLENKGVKAAALSSLESDYDVAERLKAINNSKINKTELKAGQDFIKAYLATQ